MNTNQDKNICHRDYSAFWLAGLKYLALTLIILCVTKISPVYFENQNTKFLHGLADAGKGILREDWLSGTIDGLPLFTWLVEQIYGILGDSGFYLAMFGAYSIFVVSLFSLFYEVSKKYNSNGFYSEVLFSLAIICIFAFPKLKFFFIDGHAGQYVVKSYFQTADFGVLLIASIILFITKRVGLATACVFISGVVHPGYIMPGGMILIGFAITLLLTGQEKCTGYLVTQIVKIVLGVIGLILCTIYLKFLFPQTSAEAHAESLRILTAIRIPHHADPNIWLNKYEVLKIILCLWAAIVAQPRTLKILLSLLTGIMVLTTFIGMLPSVEMLRLIAPWRVSVVIMPIASIIILSWLISISIKLQSLKRSFQIAGAYMAIVIIAVLTVLGGTRNYESFTREKPAYITFIKQNLSTGQLYLTSPKDMGFRLRTGAPQYISWKSHPYKDIEVIEWYRRNKIAKALFAQSERMNCEKLSDIVNEDNVTHVLVRKGEPSPSCDFTKEIYQMNGTGIFQISK